MVSSKAKLIAASALWVASLATTNVSAHEVTGRECLGPLLSFEQKSELITQHLKSIYAEIREDGCIYNEDHCYANVKNVLLKLQKDRPELDPLHHFNVLKIHPTKRLRGGKPSPLAPQNRVSESPDAWRYHMVLEFKNHIIDLDTQAEFAPVSVFTYFHHAFLEEASTREYSLRSSSDLGRYVHVTEMPASYYLSEGVKQFNRIDWRPFEEVFLTSSVPLAKYWRIVWERSGKP
jgi:hypothetical protein